MRVAAIMMQKDEVGLLPLWLTYYSALCDGPQHLYVFDDHSSDSSVLEALRKAAHAGVHVTSCQEGTKGIDAKGRLVSETIRSLNDRYDCYLTPDCDEFICVDSANGPAIGVEQVLSELRNIISTSNASLFRLDGSFVNVPGTTFLLRSPQKKVAVRSLPAGCTLDNGFHVYDHDAQKDLVPASLISPTNLAYIHCHYKPFHLLQRCSREKLSPYISEFSHATLLSYRGQNCHVTQHLLMTENEYRELFKPTAACIQPNEAIQNLLKSVNSGWADQSHR